MRIVHSCHGKFHHHDLARQLYARGVLEQFFTGYPRWKLARAHLPHARISTFPWVETPYMALLKTPFMRGALQRASQRARSRSFDRYVARHMPECDAFIGLSNASLRSGQKAQRQGGIYVCDRGSAHIVVQDRLLREEYARHGATFTGIDPWVIEREQAEYEQADLITVPSEFARETFREQGVPEAKLAKIPYGVDLARFQPVAEPPSKHFDVLFVGSICFRKGVPDLLTAFRDLQHPNKRLTLVGGMGEEMRAYLGNYPVPDHTVLTGHLRQPKLPEILGRAHIMVLPSVEEGLALVMAQALACGCPVIASEHTGARDLFDDGQQGFIVPIGNPAAIGECLQCLADEPGLRARMSAAALKLTRERLGGWQVYGDRMVKALTQRLSGRRGVSAQATQDSILGT